jgi:cytochrome P450
MPEGSSYIHAHDVRIINAQRCPSSTPVCEGAAMTAETPAGQPLTLNDLPMAEHRDAAWRILHDRGRLVRLDNGFAVTRPDLVEAVMKNPEIFSSRKAFDSLGSPIPMVPIAFDPPEQTRYRRILQPFFSPRAIRPLGPELRRQVIELIEPIAGRGECDFIADLSGKFPVQAFLTLFGLPLTMRDQFLVWKDAILAMSDASSAGVPETSEDGMRKAGELFMYLSELVRERRGVAGADILSQLLCAEGEDELTDNEAIGLCFLFILAGLDTVTDALGFGMERLARNPGRRQEIVDNPSLIPAAIEELVRLDPPAPFVPRVTTRETVLDGQVLPEGTRVTSLLAVANRDEGGRPEPYETNFQRGDNPQVSFGVGVHRCLGSHLARLEMRIVYEEWHRRIPDYRIADGSTPRVKWPRGTIGLESLDLVFGK